MGKSLHKKLLNISTWLLWGLVVVILADAVSTYVALSGGGFYESFVMTRFLIETFGLIVGLVFMVLINLFAVVMFYLAIIKTRKILHLLSLKGRKVAGFSFFIAVLSILLFKAFYVMGNIIQLIIIR